MSTGLFGTKRNEAFFAKRLLDLSLASVDALFLVLPILSLVLAVRLTSPGPALC